MESVSAAWSVLALSCTAAAVPVPASHTRPAPQGGSAFCFLFFASLVGQKRPRALQRGAPGAELLVC